MCGDCVKDFPHAAAGTWAGCDQAKCGALRHNDYYDPTGEESYDWCARCKDEADKCLERACGTCGDCTDTHA
jgi:hypothetical protein